MERQKNYEELTIRDHFMFGKICSKPENRKIILDSLLQIDFQEKKGVVEKEIQEYKDGKYARLDLLAEDETGTVYNAEMQNKSNDKSRQEELPKRSRYYQSIIDTAYFKSGGKYMELPESFIVFICTYDPFGKNKPIYTLETRCLEDASIEYDDKAHKIFFNTTADLSNLPQNTRNMLEYIQTGKTNNSATEIIDNEVKEARLKEEWRQEYMLTLVHDEDVRREGYDSGYDSGYESAKLIFQGKIDTLSEEFDSAIMDKNTEIERIKKEFEEYKRIHS